MKRSSLLASLVLGLGTLATVVAAADCCGYTLTAPSWGQGPQGFCSGNVSVYCETAWNKTGTQLETGFFRPAKCYILTLPVGVYFTQGPCPKPTDPIPSNMYGPSVNGNCCFVVNGTPNLTEVPNPSGVAVADCAATCNKEAPPQGS
jgi:hypothetical protein